MRLRLRGRWCAGTASVQPMDDAILARFNRYARSGPRTLGIDPVLVRIELDPLRRVAERPVRRGERAADL